MPVLVGYSPHKEDLGALDLACQLARSDGESVHAVSVLPQVWPTVVAGHTDREFEAWVTETGAGCAAEAAAHLGVHDDVPFEASWVSGRSVPQALLDRAAAIGAELVVVGSGDDVAHGQIGITSKTDRLLHSSDVPIVIAPRGYQAGPGATITRITVAFRGDDATWSLLDNVARIARRTRASTRVVTFAIRSRPMYPRRVSGAEDMVHEAWVQQAREEQAEAAAHLRSLGFTDDTLTLAVAEGRSWGGAMDSLDWERGDVLVVGSSSTHRLSQVFLGSSAAKILRHSPVPVVVVR
ncbi:universal stress protein [Fodinibacter luteus]|uniref:Universal stress protein n=1 Tax=Fodinibacter luteus TaxID=552064 RepID=A0ABP8JYX9_9MICO